MSRQLKNMPALNKKYSIKKLNLKNLPSTKSMSPSIKKKLKRK